MAEGDFSVERRFLPPPFGKPRVAHMVVNYHDATHREYNIFDDELSGKRQHWEVRGEHNVRSGDKNTEGSNEMQD